MCGRTSLFVPQPVLEDRFDATAAVDLVPRYNIAPGDDLAAITNLAPETIDLLYWGFVPHWAESFNSGYQMINARAETIDKKPAFQEAFNKRRCLVLADGFYEWQGTRGNKSPYRIIREDEMPFAMAGIWASWDGADETVNTVSIVTTEANDVLAPIHDRMPVILEPDEEQEWLTEADPASLNSLLDPCPSDLLRAYPVSRAVNDPANDNTAVIEERSDVQSGLGDFS